MKFAINIRKKLLYAADLKKRTERRGKYGMNLAVTYQKEAYEDRSKTTLRQFLFQTNINL